MRGKILFIAPYQEMAEMASEIARLYNFNVEVKMALMEEAVELAKKAEQDGIQVIISRGATLAALRKECSLPVVEIYDSNLEILRGIQKAATIGKKIGVIWYNEISCDEEFIYELLHVKVRFYKYETKEEIKRLVITALKDGVDVIVGGAYTVNFAQQVGKKGVIIGVDKETILRTLRQAQHILDIKREEEVKRKKIETIIQHAHDGIIAVDENGIITTFNPAAEKILKIKSVDVIGKCIKDIMPNSKLCEVIAGEDQLGVLEDVGSAIVSTNRVRLKVKDETVGAVITFQDVTKIQQLEQQIRQKLYNKGHVAKYSFEDIVGKSPILTRTKDIAKRFALTDETILLIGESGTGKEMFAQSIHNESKRKDGPFVAVNCAELSANLFESELFGYEEGAFTGAKKSGKAGLFLLAHRGTIFLDEISEIPISLQTAVLRVIQEKTLRPVGSDKVIPVDVRIIAATNKNLKQLVDEGLFREDLYYRLNVLTLRIPPLRERKSDIPLIVKAISQKYNCNIKLSEEAWEFLLSYSWPGNIRELINVMKRIVVLYGNRLITKSDLVEIMPEVYENTFVGKDKFLVNINNRLDDIIKQCIEKTLEMTGGNQSQAARILGVSRSFLWRKLKKGVEK